VTSLLRLVVVALVCAIGLRLALPSVFSYLGDEAWTFDHVMGAKKGEPWATLGMPSSRGVKNPAMSVWVFIILGWLGGVTTPEGLTRAVAVLALVAHAALLFIPLRILKDKADEAKPWLWAFVLTATNPIVVFLERKIWAQSVLPIFMAILFIAWMRREKLAGSFVWGLVGALVGQIHMAGFFFAPALALWTRLFDRDKRARWPAWFGGSALGSLPAIPWLLYLVRERPPPNASEWWLRFRLEFYQYFVSDPTGLSSEYLVGPDVWELMRHPLVSGHPTYLVAVAHVALAIASGQIARRFLEAAWERRAGLRELVTRGRDRSDTELLLGATLIAMGGMMTLPSISIHRHYMLAIFPLPYVWTARVALRRPGGEKWLVTLFAGCLVVSAGLLSMLRANDGAPEFGKSWAAQQRDGTSPEHAKIYRRPPP
jgi:hypothetical protein